MAIGVATIVFHELAILIVARHREEGSHRSQTATAVDGAQHGAIHDVYVHIATDGTGSHGIAAEATTTAEDITIDVRGAPRANFDTSVVVGRCTDGDRATDVGHGILYDVAILTTAERRAIDTGSVRDVDLGRSDVRPGVEKNALVALAGTEEVTGHRVIVNLFQGTRYAQCAARHVDGAQASGISCLRNNRLAIAVLVVGTHIGLLVTAIDRGQDVTANDVHRGIAAYGTCSTVPFAGSIRLDAATAAKHVAVVGVAVRSC